MTTAPPIGNIKGYSNRSECLPVRSKMISSPTRRMIAIAFRQPLFVDERGKDLFQPGEVFAASLLQAQIALELGGVVRLAHQMPNRANMSCAFSQGTIFSPASVSANVRSVIALGIRTSNGRPRLVAKHSLPPNSRGGAACPSKTLLCGRNLSRCGIARWLYARRWRHGCDRPAD